MASPSQPKGASSPTKSSLPRPLSELAPTETRRNSASYNQATKKMVFNQDSSPFQSSPFNASEQGNSSPRLFWQGRDPKSPSTPGRFNTENNMFAGRDGSPSPTRRSSIERLQKASRVKNSNMFAREQKQEYDPASVPVIERPLAKQLQGNAYGGAGLEGLRSAESIRQFGHHKNDSRSSIPLYSPTKTPLKAGAIGGRSPSKDQLSPTKSSMASRPFTPKSSLDRENMHYTEETSQDEHELPPGRVLHRHAKSVTFDAAPPQVNEYEMATPDLSSVGTGSRENSYDSAEDDEDDSYNRGDSVEHDDSFDDSLEDTDKTPVVGPDDWRHASPSSHGNGNGMVSGRLYDPFAGPEGSPMPDARPTSSAERPVAARTDSGDHRPLPPLPGMAHGRSNSASSIGLSAAGERASGRSLPSPPGAAAVSKSDIHGMTGGKMSLEERLRLMMIQDDDKPKTMAEQQRERRMRRGVPRERNSQTPERDMAIQVHEDEIEDEDTVDDLPGLESYQLPPRISRESILRKVNGQDKFSRDSDYNFSSPMPSSSPERPTPIDPDTPLPSTEDQSILDNDDSIVIKAEPTDDDIDLSSITDMYQRNESAIDNYPEAQEEVLADDDMESQYSDPTPSLQSGNVLSNSGPEDDDPPTPRATETLDPIKQDKKDSLPEFKGFLETSDFGLSLQSYMSTPSPKDSAEPQETAALSMSDAHAYLARPETPPAKIIPALKPEYDGTGWGSDEEEDNGRDSGTPESVIRHPISPSPSPSPPRESPTVPEQVATIKASGSKLKTRPSATPSDLALMREMRRHVSGEVGNIPPIPERHRSRPSLSVEPELEAGLDAESAIERKRSLKKRSLTLDIGSDLGLGLDKDFDRVIEAQKVAFSLPLRTAAFLRSGQASVSSCITSSKSFANINPRSQRGYLMRQNTKVVVASSDIDKGSRSAGNSPVKIQRPQSWTVEPWNGQMRQPSFKDKSSPRKKVDHGPVPPMPGHDSNAVGLGILNEEPAAGTVDESGERGRLFVKVMGVKDLDLPLPKSEQSWFSLTLDNGVHCVTTAWLELGRNAPIGQEFELVVPNELEFQLTLNAKLVKPAPKRVPESPTKKTQKPSAFSRVFASPKKRKELELKQKQEEQRIADEQQRDAQAKRVSTQPTAWDLLSPLAAEDGSFGRSYICLKDHETSCYGRPYVVDVACFNEWATEEVNFASSARSKRSGQPQIQRRAPYKVAKLQLQLLFVPKPRGATDDDMPKSMNSCIREMKEAEITVARSFEGHLSQQGGDCPFWRRRFFKLNGSKLTAYHESTRQPRATINLANASKLIDDRRALTQKETTTKGGKRRRSGFAEEEEGYMFVEEGFRIRFNNGEVIDFYADTAADKEGWMKVLDACVGKDSDGGKSSWCDLVLKREQSLKKRVEGGGRRHHSRTKSSGL